MIIETHNPAEMKKVVARAFGVSAKGERLTITGKGEHIYIDFVVGEHKTPAQVLDEIAKRYYFERLENDYIIRGDMMIAKDIDNKEYKIYKRLLERFGRDDGR